MFKILFFFFNKQDSFQPALPPDYQLIRKIGDGSNSDVILAEEIQTKEKVAIKITSKIETKEYCDIEDCDCLNSFIQDARNEVCFNTIYQA